MNAGDAVAVFAGVLVIAIAGLYSASSAAQGRPHPYRRAWGCLSAGFAVGGLLLGWRERSVAISIQAAASAPFLAAMLLGGMWLRTRAIDWEFAIRMDRERRERAQQTYHPKSFDDESP